MKRLLTAATAAVAAATLIATLTAQTKKPTASAMASRPAAPSPSKGFTVVEATIPEMQAALKSGPRHLARDRAASTCSASACTRSMLHAAITVNPKALELADERDRERAAGKIRGPLHGIPIALKDNVHTTFMRTTGGALAFENLMPPYDATLTKNLIDAGAIIIAKTGMSELANWVAGAPTPMPANYNAVGGQGYNPYDPRKDPREATFDGRPALQTGGSSSGIGTAANFWAGNVGSETSGSILSPSNQNMLAGDQADGRPHQPLRRDSDHRRSGHRRADGEERGRRRDHVRRDGERVARSERSGDAGCARRRPAATTRSS